jgi:2-keto-3-deoxy-L-rhamnonate aldolase RhmA
MSEFSFPALMKLLTEEMESDDPGFDWIYVDGSHEADDTMLDGELIFCASSSRQPFILSCVKRQKGINPTTGVMNTIQQFRLIPTIVVEDDHCTLLRQPPRQDPSSRL